MDHSNKRFPLFDGHLDLAHKYWTQVVEMGDRVVDATCGNGHDTLFLSSLTNELLACDVQKDAIEVTRTKVPTAQMHHGCHAELAIEGPFKLVVYNLGYLPGADKSLTTRVDTTLKSINLFLDKLAPGGAISITCYPGHPEGAREEKALLSFAATLPPGRFSVCHHRWLNRKQSPSLLLLQSA